MMRLKMRHLRHPFRAATALKNLGVAYIDQRCFVSRSKRRFQSDPRYNLQNVTNGFVSRFDDSIDDTDVLNRICTAYVKTCHDMQSVSTTYHATSWWQQVRDASLCPVMQALQTRDIHALSMMYRNFFRDACASGLIALPHGVSRLGWGVPADIYKQFYLGDALYRLDYWADQTDGLFTLRDLAGPPIGNPFGVVIDGVLVRTGAEYQHYCAQKICRLNGFAPGTFVEIGGGFGGTAYYLLRDQGKIKYLNFDVPESIALASYYLLRAFPELRFLLYGEKELTEKEIAAADVVLMPVFEIGKLASQSVDVTFSSHAMSDLSDENLGVYLETIGRITKHYFFYIGNSQGAHALSQLAKQNHAMYMVASLSSGWHRHKYGSASEIECLYSMNGSSRHELRTVAMGAASR